MLLFICAISAVNLLSPDERFSESENRVLEQRPEFSLDALLSGKFTSGYGRYLTDQFAFRDAWVGMKTDAERLLGKKDSNGVYLGKDGYLIRHYDSPPAADLANRARAIEAFHAATPGLRKFVLIAPTAASLLRDKLPPFAPVGDERGDLDRLRQALPDSVRFVDVYSAMEEEKAPGIYYRTDHHWTTKGAYSAYRELGRQMGWVAQDEAAFDVRQATDLFFGSLYSRSGYRRVEPDAIDLYLPRGEGELTVTYVDEGRTTNTLYEPDQLNKKDKYAVFLNGNHALIRITTDGPADKRLLVVKDSYANSFIPFLTKHYGEIDVVDLRYADESLTKLAQERRFTDMLILYNVLTFFEDPSILNITE